MEHAVAPPTFLHVNWLFESLYVLFEICLYFEVVIKTTVTRVHNADYILLHILCYFKLYHNIYVKFLLFSIWCYKQDRAFMCYFIKSQLEHFARSVYSLHDHYTLIFILQRPTIKVSTPVLQFKLSLVRGWRPVLQNRV